MPELNVSVNKLCRAALALALTAVVTAPAAHAQENDKPKQELYELRVYRNSDVDKQAAVLDYVDGALVPALNRQGSQPVGVFVPTEEGNADIYVLIPFQSMDQLVSLNEGLVKDSDYQQAAKDWLSTPKNDPAYQRIDSRLMRAFSGMPVLEPPSKDSADRILELRIYESHDEYKARMKVAMFNDGEIDIMKDVGMAPVFFGETLVSSDVPNLTYMLSADSPDAHKEHWQGFLKHPDWERMKGMDKYKDTVSKITSVMLAPAKASQI